MKKTIFVAIMSLLGCNYGSSLANQKPETTPTGSGGSTGAATTNAAGGAAGMGSGGESATDTGGAAGADLGGAGGAASGGAAGAATGGMQALGTGGSNEATGGTVGNGTSSVSGTGGRVSSTGGAASPDAGTTVGTGGNKDGGASDARGSDGQVPGTGGTRGTGGAQGTGGQKGTGGVQGSGGSTTACIPGTSPGQSGMDTGQACLGCHVAGGRKSDLPFTAAGSLYSSATGGSAVSGATVTITGSDNKKITIVTGKDGNFYTSSAIAFPAKVQISKCPDTVAMNATITSGDCNSCHGSSMRLHLP